jgi:hypothetical protein
VVIQFGVDRHERYIKEVWYEPERRHAFATIAAQR